MQARIESNASFIAPFHDQCWIEAIAYGPSALWRSSISLLANEHVHKLAFHVVLWISL